MNNIRIKSYLYPSLRIKPQNVLLLFFEAQTFCVYCNIRFPCYNRLTNKLIIFPLIIAKEVRCFLSGLFSIYGVYRKRAYPCAV